eukprot:PhF_6_TR31448/c0_g1_i1/m.46144
MLAGLRGTLHRLQQLSATYATAKSPHVMTEARDLISRTPVMPNGTLPPDLAVDVFRWCEFFKVTKVQDAPMLDCALKTALDYPTPHINAATMVNILETSSQMNLSENIDVAIVRIPDILSRESTLTPEQVKALLIVYSRLRIRHGKLYRMFAQHIIANKPSWRPFDWVSIMCAFVEADMLGAVSTFNFAAVGSAAVLDGLHSLKPHQLFMALRMLKDPDIASNKDLVHELCTETSGAIEKSELSVKSIVDIVSFHPLLSIEMLEKLVTQRAKGSQTYRSDIVVMLESVLSKNLKCEPFLLFLAEEGLKEVSFFSYEQWGTVLKTYAHFDVYHDKLVQGIGKAVITSINENKRKFGQTKIHMSDRRVDAYAALSMFSTCRGKSFEEARSIALPEVSTLSNDKFIEAIQKSMESARETQKKMRS